ncbi:MAG TPA: GDSL-type esterase/lipase family protein [Solirubrobacteraceae bacterium]|jgi:lysophospholipase L1-like esterase|nr:GDSL-type esterase/lipase family protein [Solirubrobacteraceae bacterium]
MTDMRSRASAARAGMLALAIAMLAPAQAPAAEKYVALGDSYSSGTGTRSYDFDPSCERGSFAYPALVVARRPGLELADFACGGATTGDVLSDQVTAVDATARWVTITIGGNDLNFSGIVRKCATPRSDAPCKGKIKRAEAQIRGDLPGRLDAVYREIRRRAPAATVIVLGYPHLFRGEDCNAATFFSPREMRWLNDTADLLRDTMRERVAAAGPGFVFEDAIPAFRGHEVCAKTEWLNGLSKPTGNSYHPNRAGHAGGYAPLVLDAMAHAPPPVGDRLSDDARLVAADDGFLRSADGRYRLVMQRDGNLVLYGPSGRALWATSTVGRGADHVRMQRDGNFVMYDAQEHPLWSSGTAGHPNAFVIVQNDGNVVIYAGGRALWSTGTAGQT